MQLDSKYLYVELLKWSAYMRSLTFLKPCLLTFTDCLQVEYAWVRAQKSRRQKPLVKNCEKCMCLELWLQSKAEIHLGLTCLRFSRSYMQTNLNSQTGNSLNANSGYSVLGCMHSRPKIRVSSFLILLSVARCGFRLWVFIHLLPSVVWKIEGCGQAPTDTAPYGHCRVQHSH